MNKLLTQRVSTEGFSALAGDSAAHSPGDPLDAAGALAAAVQDPALGPDLGSGGHPDGPGRASAQRPAPRLLWTAPWVVRYLWFLGPGAAGGADAAGGTGVARALRALGALRRSRALRPGHPAFGPAALCLRCAPSLEAVCVQYVISACDMTNLEVCMGFIACTCRLHASQRCPSSLALCLSVVSLTLLQPLWLSH